MKWLRDIFLALLVGLGAGMAVAIFFLIIGSIIGGIKTGCIAMRSGLMIAGGFLMLFGAIQILKDGHLPEEAFKLFPSKQKDASDGAEYPNPWYRLIVLPKKHAVIISSVSIILLSGIADHIVRAM